LKKERKGEWNSRLHRQNPPTRVEERKKIGRIEFAPTQTKPADAGLKKERKGEWNSRLHRQNPPTRVEERKKTGRMELGCFLYTF